MFQQRIFIWLLPMILLSLMFAPTEAQQEEFVFGVVLIGGRDDQGWNQAHFEAGQYVEQQIQGARMEIFDRLNPADAPDTSLSDVVGSMVERNARLIFTAAAEFEGDTNTVARAFPDVVFINIEGDDVLAGTAPSNVGNLMAQMEWGQLISGCAAGIATQSGNIGYLGSVANNETRRFAASAYLGARYCSQTYARRDPQNLGFSVTWIGFRVAVPDVTLDPVEEVNRLYDSGADVVISGLDGSDVLTVANQRTASGEPVWAIPYNDADTCVIAPDVCLGVAYFNWRPAYIDTVQQVRNGNWTPIWNWEYEPNWDDINSLGTSSIGFIFGAGLNARNRSRLTDFVADLAEYATNPFVPESLALWSGPLNLQDGTRLANERVLVDILDVWYLGQLLEGMSGESQ